MSRANETPTKPRKDNVEHSGRRALFPSEDNPKGQEWLTRKKNRELEIHSPPVLQRPDISGQNFINFVTILGPARQGKSFLLNCLIGKDIFEMADTMGVCTKGVKISSIVHKANDNSSFLFVDTEGQGDEDVDSDVTLLTPVLLVSKVILFNWKGGLQKNKILDELAILVEFANSVSSKNFNDDSPTFGHLHVLLRDFHFDGTAEEAFNRIFTEEKERGEKVRERNKLREKLLFSFESIRVFIIPPPGNDLTNLRLRDTDEAFQKSVKELKDKVWSQMSKPRYFGSTVVDSRNAGTLVRKFAEVLQAGEIVHLRSVVGEMQRRKIDAAKESFQKDLVNAFAAIKVPMKDGIENALALKKDEYLAEFINTTKTIDLEVVYKDEVYEKLEEFGDREIEAKRRENLLAIQSKDIEEKGLLVKAAEKFRELFEKKLTAVKATTSSSELKQDLESYQRELVEGFLRSSKNLDWNRDLAEQEKEKLTRWSSKRLCEKVEERQKDEQRREEQKAMEAERRARERERELEQQAFQMQQETYSPFSSYSSYTSPSTPSYPSTPPSSSTAGLKHYKGGQFIPGGGRAPKGGCYMKPPSASRSSSTSSSSSGGGGKFYKGGQFLPGGGRAPKGGCRR